MKTLIFLLAFAVTARAQTNSCQLIDSRQLNSIAQGAVTYVGGPVFSCSNGTRIAADSAIIVKATNRADFIGNVRFNEAERSLTSQYAQYISAERRLMAQQDVVLVDKANGSTLRGLSLNYLQAAPNRASRIDVHAGRPRAVIVRQAAAPNPTARVDTTIIDADRMQIEGENVFRGWGNVDVRRGTMKSNSAFAEFDQNGSYMRLYGQARVETDTMKLRADSIDADLLNRDEFKEIRARRDAKLEAEAGDIEAPRLRIMFAEGEVERLIAVGGKRINDAAPQATSKSEDFSLVADSIDARTPGQQIREVIAIGTALGERTADTTDAKMPDLIAKDWVRGDTVQAYFTTDTVRATVTPRPAGGTGTVAAADTVRQVLERIIAKGSPASSTYRLREIVNDTAEISVNYLTAKSIDVRFSDGEVDRVNASGDIRGIYLQPPRRTQAVR